MKNFLINLNILFYFSLSACLFINSCKTGTPLMIASYDGDYQALKQCVENGDNIEQVDTYYGWTPLMWNIYYDYSLSAKYLIEKGANVNSRAEMKYGPIQKGASPLIIAAYYGRKDIVKILLNHGANKSFKDSIGYTAIDYARYYQFREIVKMLEN